MDHPTPTTLFCPYCRSGLVRYPSGYSEYDVACDPCEAGFAPDEATGLVRSRRWDRQAACGIQSEFLLADLAKRPETSEEAGS